jgi:transcriptional regulator with XRE-family HTH domain
MWIQDAPMASNVPSYVALPYLWSWRMLRGLTQLQLTQQTGMSNESVRRIEHGRKATARSVAALAKALHISLSQLLQGVPTQLIG